MLIGIHCYEVCTTRAYCIVCGYFAVEMREVYHDSEPLLISLSLLYFFVSKARAIENQCFVIASAQYGIHNEKRTSYGHSLVIDPWGTVVADAGGMDGSGTTDGPVSLIVCDIDTDQLASVRGNMPIQQHRAAARYE
jgi:hypothetical protein